VNWYVFPETNVGLFTVTTPCGPTNTISSAVNEAALIGSSNVT
jgi:hypothetical protein